MEAILLSQGLDGANAAAVEMHIGAAVAFALAGFFLVSGIEIAGKIISSKKS